MNTTIDKFIEGLNILWTITSKDIVDALRNKLIMSMIVGLSLMLTMPKVMNLIIDPPYTQVFVYDPGNSRLSEALKNSPQFNVVRVNSISKLEEMIGGTGLGLGAEFGVAIPPDFDQKMKIGEEVVLEGYAVWANRSKAAQLKSSFEQQFTALADEPVQINIEGNIIYPSPDSTLLLSILSWTSVFVILAMGINLVPHLLFEEKLTKTLDALLVSPANAGQVVMGKALAGLFYILVTVIVVFAFNWAGIVNWEIAILFAILSGLFCVALGLVLGSFFEHQQEIAGLTMVLIMIFVGAMFIDSMELEVPAFIDAIVPWVPSVALSDILQLSYLEKASWVNIWPNLSSLLGFSLMFYALVIWKVRRSDR